MTRLQSAYFREAGNWPTNFNVPRRTVLAIMLLVALIAFELFNFDTTRYALTDFLGDVSFWGLSWATILATAFCAIDFAGLARLFTPEQGADEPRAVWYLMGAWLLGATMNAAMTWWAISLTLLNHELGNEILSREQLLYSVPLFVAALVWLTRILFIGALSVAGDHLFNGSAELSTQSQPRRSPQTQPVNKPNTTIPTPPPQREPRSKRPSSPPHSRTRPRAMPGQVRRAPAGMMARDRAQERDR